MLTPLLATKLFIPPTGKYTVIRSRLLKKLDQGLLPSCRLTLVCAPAGFRKTTLLSTWVKQLMSSESPSSVTWLSLDDGDNALFVF
jgi:LuxR family maltose regulon positive regulatory protein